MRRPARRNGASRPTGGCGLPRQWWMASSISATGRGSSLRSTRRPVRKSGASIPAAPWCRRPPSLMARCTWGASTPACSPSTPGTGRKGGASGIRTARRGSSLPPRWWMAGHVGSSDWRRVCWTATGGLKWYFSTEGDPWSSPRWPMGGLYRPRGAISIAGCSHRRRAVERAQQDAVTKDMRFWRRGLVAGGGRWRRLFRRLDGKLYAVEAAGPTVRQGGRQGWSAPRPAPCFHTRTGRVVLGFPLVR
jgi:hypothetical protein